MLGLNLGLLQLVHWQSDALTTKLDLIREKLDLIRIERNHYKKVWLAFLAHLVLSFASWKLLAGQAQLRQHSGQAWRQQLHLRLRDKPRALSLRERFSAELREHPSTSFNPAADLGSIPKAGLRAGGSSCSAASYPHTGLGGQLTSRLSDQRSAAVREAAPSCRRTDRPLVHLLWTKSGFF